MINIDLNIIKAYCNIFDRDIAADPCLAETCDRVFFSINQAFGRIDCQILSMIKSFKNNAIIRRINYRVNYLIKCQSATHLYRRARIVCPLSCGIYDYLNVVYFVDLSEVWPHLDLDECLIHQLYLIADIKQTIAYP